MCEHRFVDSWLFFFPKKSHDGSGSLAELALLLALWLMGARRVDWRAAGTVKCAVSRSKTCCHCAVRPVAGNSASTVLITLCKNSFDTRWRAWQVMVSSLDSSNANFENNKAPKRNCCGPETTSTVLGNWLTLVWKIKWKLTNGDAWQSSIY